MLSRVAFFFHITITTARIGKVLPTLQQVVSTKATPRHTNVRIYNTKQMFIIISHKYHYHHVQISVTIALPHIKAPLLRNINAPLPLAPNSYRGKLQRTVETVRSESVIVIASLFYY
jgi:hypothetical protein